MEIKKNGYYKAVSIISYISASLICLLVAVVAIIAMVDASILEEVFEIMIESEEYYVLNAGYADPVYAEAYSLFKSYIVVLGVLYLGIAAYTFIQAAYFMKYSKLTDEQASKCYGRCLAWCICSLIFSGWVIGLIAFLGLFNVQKKQKLDFEAGVTQRDKQEEQEEVTLEKLEQVQIRLAKLQDLKTTGALTEEEFKMMRNKVMSELHLEKEKTEIDVTAERLNKLNELKENGSISEEEYERLKERIFKK